MRRRDSDISALEALYRYCTRQMSRVSLRLHLGQWQALRRRSAKALQLGASTHTNRQGDQPEPGSTADIPGPPRAVKVELPRTESGEVDWAAIKPCPMSLYRYEPHDPGFFSLKRNDYTADLFRATRDRSQDYQRAENLGPPRASILDAPKQDYPIRLGNYADFKEMCYTGRARIVEMDPEQNLYAIALELVDEIASQYIGRELIWTEEAMKDAFARRDFSCMPILNEAWGKLMAVKHGSRDS